MTEYRLVPVEPTEEMIEAVDALIQKTHKEDIHFPDGVRLVWATLLAAAPPAHTREEVARVIYDELEGPVANQDFGRQMRQWAQCEKIADAILSLLGRRP